jgi:hypothetical protein
MPVEIIYLDNGRGLLVKCCAPLSGNDKIKTNEVLLRSPDELAKLRYLVIETTSGEFHCSTEEVRIISAQDKQIAKIAPQDLHVALIVPSDVDFGMARMWQVFAEETGWQTAVFRSCAGAGTWLNDALGENSYSSLASQAR